MKTECKASSSEKPGAGIPHAGICAGGTRQRVSLPRYITAYLDSTGTTVATYTYDAFGRTINKSGTHATTFSHRFSTKCYDPETGLYYYGYRFYSPDLMRWLNRDPIEEKGGLNFYCIVGNQSVNIFDALGLRIQTEYVISPQIIQVTQGVVGGETEVVKADIYTKVNTSCANGCKGETWLLDAVIRVTYFAGTHHPQYVDVARHEGTHVSIWLSALMAIENALLDGTCAKEDCHTAKINYFNAQYNHAWRDAMYQNVKFDCREYGNYGACLVEANYFRIRLATEQKMIKCLNQMLSVCGGGTKK